jgi:small acid-soluble spore protein I (minor)
MDISIKKHILENFKDLEKEEIRCSIEEIIDSQDELVLPGLGVFFQLLWTSSDLRVKDEILDIIFNAIKKESI